MSKLECPEWLQTEGNSVYEPDLTGSNSLQVFSWDVSSLHDLDSNNEINSNWKQQWNCLVNHVCRVFPSVLCLQGCSQMMHQDLDNFLIHNNYKGLFIPCNNKIGLSIFYQSPRLHLLQNDKLWRIQLQDNQIDQTVTVSQQQGKICVQGSWESLINDN